jgi:hypothetical protein
MLQQVVTAVTLGVCAILPVCDWAASSLQLHYGSADVQLLLPAGYYVCLLQPLMWLAVVAAMQVL